MPVVAPVEEPLPLPVIKIPVSSQWLGLNSSNLSKNWLNVVLVTGSASGAILLGTFVYRRYIRTDPKSFRNVNGSAKSPSSPSTTDSSRSLTAPVPRGRASREETCGGLAILLEEEEEEFNRLNSLRGNVIAENTNRPFVPMRRRSDSVTSGTTTLLLTTRSPSELMLYGCESLKRAIRLFEETRNKINSEARSISSDDFRESSVDSELEFILSKARQLVDDVEDYRQEITPDRDSNNFQTRDTVCSSPGSEGSFGASTTITLPFFDIEPNIHFFKFYTQAVDEFDDILAPRVDRTSQLNCESREEFVAKVHCLRLAFTDILGHQENRDYFAEIGRDILDVLLAHSLKDPDDCLRSYEEFLLFVTNHENHAAIETEVRSRAIPCLSFYDVVLDYIIMDSFADLENPPSAVLSVANNKWLSSGFRELALQTAVSAVLRHKRSRLTVPAGFFGNFYNILEHISPVLAWGFLGSDYELKNKCIMIKESLQELIRDIFSFDRVRYTSLTDLTADILRLADDNYNDLTNKLTTCK